jgi:hypothetical protein
MNVGIYAAFDRTESTAAAVSLAASASRCGHATGYMPCNLTGPCDLRQYGVSVYSSRSYATWVASHSCFVWFRQELKLLEEIRRQHKASKHILVPTWHHLGPDSLKALTAYDLTVCGSETMKRELMRRVPKKTKLASVPWDMNIVPQLRLGVRDFNCVRVLVSADNHTVEHHAESMLQVVEHLLANPDIRVDLALARRLAPAHRRQLQDLLARFDSLKTTWQPGMEELLQLTAASDWVWVPATKSTFGISAIRALSLGVPAVAWDISPFDSLLPSSSLLPCRVDIDSCGDPAVVWDTDVLLHELPLLFKDREQLLTRQGLQMDRGPAFQSFWQRIWCGV